MTVTINIPENAEVKLQQEAERQGVPIPSLIEDIVVERFGSQDIEFDGMKALLEALAVSDVYIPHDKQNREYIYD